MRTGELELCRRTKERPFRAKNIEFHISGGRMKLYKRRNDLIYYNTELQKCNVTILLKLDEYCAKCNRYCRMGVF